MDPKLCNNKFTPCFQKIKLILMFTVQTNNLILNSIRVTKFSLRDNFCINNTTNIKPRHLR